MNTDERVMMLFEITSSEVPKLPHKDAFTPFVRSASSGRRVEIVLLKPSVFKEVLQAGVSTEIVLTLKLPLPDKLLRKST
ncbi:hypothetical protein D3C87_1655360 [compost metagenome]